VLLKMILFDRIDRLVKASGLSVSA